MSLRTMHLYTFCRIIDFAVRAPVGLQWLLVVAIGQLAGREVRQHHDRKDTRS